MGKITRAGAIVPAERVRALRSADEILADAARQAEVVLGAARAGARELEASTRARAADEGRDEAAALLAVAAAERQRMLGAVQGDVVALAVEIARKIIHRELEVDPELAARLCTGALRQVALARAVTLRVSPDDLATVGSRSQALAAVLEEGASLKVVGDAAVGRGGCVVESDMGRIDARLETQLAAIERALMADDA
jgi:type III secretion system HrpE/YscL family protein